MGKKVLVLGAYGLLGSSLCPFLRDAGFQILMQGRNKNSEITFDLNNLQDLQKNLEYLSPDTIINLIAATNVDECEKDNRKAKFANVEIVKNLIKVIKNNSTKVNPHLVHLSTDQVYDGKGPHKEDDARPINFYAKSKYLGELEALKINSTVLRVNFIGKSRNSNKNSLSDWIVNSAKNKKKITVFQDVYFSPLHISILCKNIALVLEKKFKGIFNLGSSEGISKADFAFKLCELLKLDKNLLIKGNFLDSQLLAKRPLDMQMNIKKYENKFQVLLSKINQQIELTANDYK